MFARPKLAPELTLKFIALVMTASLAAPRLAHAQSARAATSSEWSPWDVTHATLAPAAAPTAAGIAVARGIALRNGVTLRDGTIDVDIPMPDGRGTQFAGIAFRMASTADYEIVYFQSSTDGARWAMVQYQPVYEGETTWQLYQGAGYETPLPMHGDLLARRGPMHVRLVIVGRRADLYVDSMTTPVLRVRELKRAPVAGGVGVWAISPDSAASRFEAFTARTGVETPPVPAPPETAPAGQLMQWRVSARMPSPDGVTAPRELTPALRAAADTGSLVSAERSGLVNLTAALGNPAGRQQVNVFGGAGYGMAVARVTLVSEREQTVRLRFGYSDGVGIFLDGRSLFAGRNDYDSRYRGYIATMSRDADAVDLPLHAGRNELVFIVTDKAFGWGFAARLEEPSGVRAEP